MSKSKIQPLAPTIRRISQIVLLLCLSHSAPLPLLALVPPHVEVLDADNQADVVSNQTKENLVALTVVGSIRSLIDVRCNDRGSLDAHVVHGRADGPRPYRAGVS